MLTEAVQDGGQAMRDPVGGSVEFHFVPILKLISTLLIMGVFDDEDVTHILKMLEPTVFSGKKPEEPIEELANVKEEKERKAPPKAAAREEQEAEWEEEDEFEDDGLGEDEEEEEEEEMEEELENTEDCMPHEETVDETERVNGEKGAEETEKEKHAETRGENKEEHLEQGLFQMKLPEAVKLQVTLVFLEYTKKPLKTTS